MGRSRGGLTGKIHAPVDANGLPVQLGLTPGEAHDNRLCLELLAGLQPRPMLLADPRYDADWIRALVKQSAHLPWPLPVSRAQPRRAALHKIKQCRRIAIHYDKLAANYLAVVELATNRIWLCAYESTLKILYLTRSLNADWLRLRLRTL